MAASTISYAVAGRTIPPHIKHIPNGSCESHNSSVGRNVFSPRRLDDLKRDRESLKCEHYNMTGHTISTCFRLHGYMEWYKDLRAEGRQAYRRPNIVNAATDTPLDGEDLIVS